MDIQKILREGMDWIDLGQDREKWRAVINAVMTLVCQQMRGISWLGEGSLVFQEILYWLGLDGKMHA